MIKNSLERERIASDNPSPLTTQRSLVVKKLALDVGDKRIGVAISDPTCTLAVGLATIERKIKSSSDVFDKLKDIIEQQNIGEIIVGIPFEIDGTEGNQAKKVREFANLIEDTFDLPVREWDERLTSVQAERVLIAADMRREKRKRHVDRIAAVLILQGYLDNLQRKT